MTTVVRYFTNLKLSMEECSRFPEEENDNSLHYSCPGEFHLRIKLEAVTVHGVTKVRHDWYINTSLHRWYTDFPYMYPFLTLFQVYLLIFVLVNIFEARIMPFSSI